MIRPETEANLVGPSDEDRRSAGTFYSLRDFYAEAREALACLGPEMVLPAGDEAGR